MTNNARTTGYLSGVRISPKIIHELLQVAAEDKHPEKGTFVCLHSLGMRGRNLFKLSIVSNMLALISIAFFQCHTKANILVKK